MSFYKGNLLNHFKDIQPALAKVNAHAMLDARNFQLELRANGNRFVLRPQFVNWSQGQSHYTPHFVPGVTRFIGWCPYFNKRWPLSDEKLKFKAYAVANGLRTPAYSTDPAAVLKDVIVKRNMSSFGKEIKGPLRSSREHSLQPGNGEFYESFIEGRIVKIWFWNHRAVCLEEERCPTVTGDGKKTIGELIGARVEQRSIKVDVAAAAAYLAYRGRSLEQVLALDEQQTIDFRYGSQMNYPADTADVNLLEKPIPELTPQLAEIGSSLWNGIPEPIRMGTVYSVDAVRDAENRLWVLEMNSNPFIHPYVYVPMLSDLFENKVPAFASALDYVPPRPQSAEAMTFSSQLHGVRMLS